MFGYLSNLLPSFHDFYNKDYLSFVIPYMLYSFASNDVMVKDLCISILEDDYQKCQVIVNKNVDLRTRYCGKLILTYAMNNPTIFKYLLEKGAQTMTWSHEDSLLNIAVQKNKFDICEILLKHGYDINYRLNSVTALHVAAKNGFVDMYGFLLLNGANDNFVDQRHNKPMVYMCENRPELCNIFKFIDKMKKYY